MTFATAVGSGQTVNFDATLVIDGIPILFGSADGIALTTSSVFVSGLPASMTSVDAIVRGSLSVGGSELDQDQLIVQPSGCGVSLKADPRWDLYFERRRSPQTILTSTTTTVNTAFNVQSSAGFGGYAYCDRETMTVSALPTAQTMTIGQRNYAALAGGKAAVHSVGAVLSIVPRFLVGRLAELRFHVGDQTKLARRMRVSKIEWNAKNNSWDLAFIDAMEFIADRKIATGFDGCIVESLTVNLTAIGTLIDVQLRNFEFIPSLAGIDGLWLWFTDGKDMNGGQPFPAKVYTYNNATGLVSCYAPALALFLIGSQRRRIGEIVDFTSLGGLICRFSMLLNGPPIFDLLKVLLSDKGDGTNSSDYDVLYGKTTTGSGTGDVVGAYETEKRFGAALTTDLVDMATLAAEPLLRKTCPGWVYWLGSRSETNLRDLLEEVAWAAGVIFFINDSGKLSCKPLSAVGVLTPRTFAITDENVLPATSFNIVDDETEVVHSIEIKCNMDPVSGDYRGTVNIRDVKTYETYRDAAKTLKLERAGLMIAAPAQNAEQMSVLTSMLPGTMGDAVNRFSRNVYRRQNGIIKVILTVDMATGVMLSPGDIGTITHPNLKAFDGGSLNGAVMEVASVGSISMDGQGVEVTLWSTYAVKPLSPTCKVASYAAGVITLTVSDKYGSGATPSSYYAVGWKVQLLDYSAAPPFSAASPVLTVTNVSGATVTVTGMGAFAPAAGDILVQATYDSATSTVASVALASGQQSHTFQADTGFLLGTANAAADVYG